MAFQVEPAQGELTRQRQQGAISGSAGRNAVLPKSSESPHHRLFSACICLGSRASPNGLAGHAAFLPGPGRIRIPSRKAPASLDPCQPTGPSPGGAGTSLSFLASPSPPASSGRLLKRKGQAEPGWPEGLCTRVFLSHWFPTYLAEKTPLPWVIRDHSHRNTP